MMITSFLDIHLPYMLTIFVALLEIIYFLHYLLKLERPRLQVTLLEL